jgi:hypothetical protein
MQQTIVDLSIPQKAIAVCSQQLRAAAGFVEPPTVQPHRDVGMLITGIGRPRSAIVKALAAFYYLTAQLVFEA